MKPDVDDRIRATVDLLTRSAPPAPPFERIESRRRRRHLARQMEAACLVAVVVAGAVAGTWGLTKVFHGPGTVHRPGAELPPAANGRIAFLSDRDFGPDGVGLYAVNDDGTGPVRLTNEPISSSSVAWSPDGRTIAFTRAVSEEEGEIDLIDADGTGLRVLARLPQPYQVAWSPDGLKIVYSAGPASIHVMRSDGTGDTQLTDPPSPCGDEAPSWSPDGGRIAFRRFCNERDMGIYSIAADGTGLTKLASTQVRDSGPAWSPDGTTIVFGGAGQVQVMNADGTGRTTLTSEGENFFPVWSPDGTKIAFTSDRDGNREIYVMDADGSDQTNISHDPADDYAPAWQPIPAQDASPVPSPGLGSECKPSSASGDFDGDGVPDRATLGDSACFEKRTPIDTPWALAVDYANGGGLWPMPECSPQTCRALGAGDINGDGVDELAVVVETGASTQFVEFFEVPLGPDGPQTATVVPPGAEGFPSGMPAKFPYGGSVTRFGAFGCGEGDVVSEVATLDADQTEWAVHVTNLHLDTTGPSPRFTVVSIDDSTQAFDPEVGVGDVFEAGAPCWMEPPSS